VRHLVAAITLIAAGIAVAACSSPSSAPADGASRSTTRTPSPVVTIENFAFAPRTLTVAPGTMITVVNADAVSHTLTAVSGAFDTGDIAGGATAHFAAPTTPGTYPYRCDIHQFMTGTLVVS